jgi:hypothetical protein
MRERPSPTNVMTELRPWGGYSLVEVFKRAGWQMFDG